MPYMNSTSTLGNGAVTSGFRIKRTLATVQGQQSAADPTVVEVLTELEELLGKAIFKPGDAGKAKVTALVGAELRARRADDTRSVKPNGAKKQAGAAGAGAAPAGAAAPGAVAAGAAAPAAGAAAPPAAGAGAAGGGGIAPKADKRWPSDSLADKFTDEVSGAGERSLHAVLSSMADFADLRYALDAGIDGQWSILDPSIRLVLGYSGIRDLLFARGTLVHGITSPDSLLRFVLSHAEGAQDIVDYTIVSAARKIAVEESIFAPALMNDNGSITEALTERGPKLTEGAFRMVSLDVIRSQLGSAKFDSLIASHVPAIPDYLKPRVLMLLKTSPVTVTPQNGPFLLQMYLEQAASTTPGEAEAPAGDPFAVQFYGDDSSAESVNTAAVRCAAQLFYVMTLGDELGVFDAVRYFTETYLFHDGLAIQDPVLRKDLEDYVFSNRFPVKDPSTGLPDKVDATREPMRKAYYRQVFNSGEAPTAGDAPVNEEFGRLWKILILESARYLERAQISPNPDSFVSRQNVMQAVEDLQYNLSSSCVGLATVMTPTINAELDFVINRILGHAEIRSHVVPGGGSWLKVVEKLAAARGTRARVSVLNNKARLGYTLIKQIADYTAWTFEQDEPFSQFISNVDAFITTQSILQEDTTGHEDGGSSSAAPSSGGMPGLPGMPDLSNLPGMPAGVGSMPGSSNGNGSGSSAGSAGADDWDF